MILRPGEGSTSARHEDDDEMRIGEETRLWVFSPVRIFSLT